ncbi:MAG: hypothetical protein WCA35_09805, partial [Kovacikia sp.]
MNAEEALEIVEKALGEERLTKLQVVVFRHTWNELSYQEVARDSGYEVGYIKQMGSQLWQAISNALGEKARKGNIHVVVKRYAARRQKAEAEEMGAERQTEVEGPGSSLQEGGLSLDPQHSVSRVQPLDSISLAPLPPLSVSLPLQDWGEATDVSIFYGRAEE